MLDLFDKIVKEAALIRAAPVSSLTILAIGMAAGTGIGLWHYSGRLDEKDGQIARYRVALGIDPASKGALIELTNQELAVKAQSTVSKLRDLASKLDKKFEFIKQQKDAKKLDDKQAFEQSQQAMKDISQDFDKGLASDAYNVEQELRKRLDPSAISHVIRVPAIISDDGTRIPLMALARGTGLDTFYIRGLADEIEQMAKLLA